MNNGYQKSNGCGAAKKCAIIAVDEIIKEYEEKIIYAAYYTDFELWKDRQNYWEEVKQEINQINN